MHRKSFPEIPKFVTNQGQINKIYHSEIYIYISYTMNRVMLVTWNSEKVNYVIE